MPVIARCASDGAGRQIGSLINIVPALWRSAAHPRARPDRSNRSHVWAIDSKAGPGMGLNGLARSGAHNNTPRRGLCGSLAKWPSTAMLPRGGACPRGIP